jgi:hypothetical protein
VLVVKEFRNLRWSRQICLNNKKHADSPNFLVSLFRSTYYVILAGFTRSSECCTVVRFFQTKSGGTGQNPAKADTTDA